MTESKQLRMMRIALRLASQYGLGKKTFSPQRDKTTGVKILGMYRPDTH